VALGYVAFTERRTEESVARFQRALELNPNFAAAHGYLGWTLAFDAQSDRAIAHSLTAIRMSPHDPQDVIFYGVMGAAHYLAGRYEEAINCAVRVLGSRPTFTGVEELLQVQPELSVSWIKQNLPYTPRALAKFVEGWRKVGLREH
jgi:tetratricopeptide (TPR) repeat protein